ncbi:MAG: CHAD domain-containing protein [Flavobacteriales bacterium]|nr:CHAD domain-containing protein [Flavobacteriales bacterium]
MAFLLAGHGRELLERFGEALRVARERPTEKRVHGLRVRMKKLRSLLRLAEAMAPGDGPPKGPMRRLLALFKMAGEQRETVVSAKVVRSLPLRDPTSAEPYVTDLGDRGRKAGKAMRKAMDDLRPRDIQRLRRHLGTVGNALTHTQERKAARRYVAMEMRRARTLLRRGAPGEELHEVRKHLKNAWHTLRLLGDTGPLDERQNDLLGRLDGLQENLGDWHDIQVVVEDLDRTERRPAVLRRAAMARQRRERNRLMRSLQKALEP